MCSKLHCQKFFNLKSFWYEIVARTQQVDLRTARQPARGSARKRAHREILLD